MEWHETYLVESRPQSEHLKRYQRRRQKHNIVEGYPWTFTRRRGAEDAAQQAQSISDAKKMFQDIIDDLFKETGKQIIRSENEIRFSQLGEVLRPYQLSSGEKQMLAILLTVLVEDRKPYVLFMDEPEVSLHFEWQKRLIELILKLNPNVQLIVATHSPAVIMNGWMDHVTEVTDITL